MSPDMRQICSNSGDETYTSAVDDVVNVSVRKQNDSIVLCDRLDQIFTN